MNPPFYFYSIYFTPSILSPFNFPQIYSNKNSIKTTKLEPQVNSQVSQQKTKLTSSKFGTKLRTKHIIHHRSAGCFCYHTSKFIFSKAVIVSVPVGRQVGWLVGRHTFTCKMSRMECGGGHICLIWYRPSPFILLQLLPQSTYDSSFLLHYCFVVVLRTSSSHHQICTTICT